MAQGFACQDCGRRARKDKGLCLYCGGALVPAEEAPIPTGGPTDDRPNARVFEHGPDDLRSPIAVWIHDIGIVLGMTLLAALLPAFAFRHHVTLQPWHWAGVALLSALGVKLGGLVFGLPAISGGEAALAGSPWIRAMHRGSSRIGCFLTFALFPLFIGRTLFALAPFLFAPPVVGGFLVGASTVYWKLQATHDPVAGFEVALRRAAGGGRYDPTYELAPSDWYGHSAVLLGPQSTLQYNPELEMRYPFVLHITSVTEHRFEGTMDWPENHVLHVTGAHRGNHLLFYDDALVGVGEAETWERDGLHDVKNAYVVGSSQLDPGGKSDMARFDRITGPDDAMPVLDSECLVGTDYGGRGPLRAQRKAPEKPLPPPLPAVRVDPQLVGKVAAPKAPVILDGAIFRPRLKGTTAGTFASVGFAWAGEDKGPAVVASVLVSPVTPKIADFLGIQGSLFDSRASTPSAIVKSITPAYASDEDETGHVIFFDLEPGSRVEAIPLAKGLPDIGEVVWIGLSAKRLVATEVVVSTPTSIEVSLRPESAKGQLVLRTDESAVGGPLLDQDGRAYGIIVAEREGGLHVLAGNGLRELHQP
jgi:hypothetical protein